MEKIYKSSPIAMLWSLITMVFAVGIVFIIAGFFLETKIALGIALVLGILILWNIFSDIKTKVVIHERTLKIFIGKKIYQYDIDQVSLASKSVNQDSFTLYVTDRDGKEERFDLSSLGLRQYHDLISELGIIGEKSEAIKLDVTR